VKSPVAALAGLSQRKERRARDRAQAVTPSLLGGRSRRSAEGRRHSWGPGPARRTPARPPGLTSFCSHRLATEPASQDSDQPAPATPNPATFTSASVGGRVRDPLSARGHPPPPHIAGHRPRPRGPREAGEERIARDRMAASALGDDPALQKSRSPTLDLQ
jgi:hypothetical protein